MLGIFLKYLRNQIGYYCQYSNYLMQNSPFLVEDLHYVNAMLTVHPAAAG